MGYPSRTDDFQKELQLYLFVELRKPEIGYIPAAILEMTYSGNTVSSVKSEIYAYLFAWADGKKENMPENLRPFYNWDMADRLVSLLTDGQKVYWLK